MALNAFMTFFGDADGESHVKGHEKEIEVEGWDWEVEAAVLTSLGSGASAGKPKPSALRWSHFFDSASLAIIRRIITGAHFAKARLQLFRSSSHGPAGSAALYLTITVEDVLITRVGQVGTDDGRALQSVEMVFQKITFEYRRASPSGGAAATQTLSWDIPAGTASPSA